MEWQAVVMALQILMLAIGWQLFQKARAELSARAAETPILGEVRALQKNVRQLLSELTETAEVSGSHLETRIVEAREALAVIDSRLSEMAETEKRLKSLENRLAERAVSGTRLPAADTRLTAAHSTAPPLSMPAPDPVFETPVPPKKTTRRTSSTPATRKPKNAEAVVAVTTVPSPTLEPLSPAKSLRQNVYALADAGKLPLQIARETGISEGEVETLLGLRQHTNH